MAQTLRMKPLYAALLASTLAPAAAFAQDQTTSVDLPMFRVTESTIGIDPNIPANTASITADVLGRLNMPATEDVLKYLPNLNVRQRYIGDRNGTLEVRGTSNIQSSRSLVLADGVILSNFLGTDHGFGPRWSMVLPIEIDRVDVIYGPYSALYSGNAMGAAVIYTTKMPERLQAGAKLTAHRQEFDLNGTDDTYDGHVLNAYVGDRIGRFSYVLSASTLEMTSQPTGFAFLNPNNGQALQGDETVIASGAYPIVDRRGADQLHIGIPGSGIETTEQDEFKLKLGYDFSPTLEGRFTIASWTMDSLTGKKPQYTSYLIDEDGNRVYSGAVNIDGARYTIGNGVFAPRSGAEEHWMYAATLRTKNASGWNYEAAASLYDMKEHVSRTSNLARDVAYSTGGAGTLQSLDGSGWWHVDLKADNRFGKHWLTVGAHHSNYELKQRNYTTDDWRNGGPGSLTRANQGSTMTTALFAQDAWQFAEQWKTVLGLRVEKWESQDGSRTAVGGTPSVTTVTPYPDRSESEVSPKIALIYTPSQDLSYRLSLAKSTRFPTVCDLYQDCTNVAISNPAAARPEIKPEDAVSVDYTVEMRLDNAVMRVSLWGEESRDAIFRYQEFNVVDNTLGVTAFQNIDRVRVKGIEWVYDTWNLFGLMGLDLHANLAFNDSEVLKDSNDPRNVGNEFYRIPRIRGALVATYRHTDKLDYTLAGRYSGRSHASLDNTDINRHAIDGVSNFTVFDLRVNYEINRHIGLGGGVNNLLDERYYVGHPYQGRTIFADVKLTY